MPSARLPCNIAHGTAGASLLYEQFIITIRRPPVKAEGLAARSGRAGAHPFVGVHLPAALREVAAVAFRIAHANLRLGAVRRPRLDGGAAALDPIRHRLGIPDQNAEMGDAEARFVPNLVAVEGLDRNIAVPIAHMLVPIAGPLHGFLVRLDQFAEAADRAVEH